MEQREPHTSMDKIAQTQKPQVSMVQPQKVLIAFTAAIPLNACVLMASLTYSNDLGIQGGCGEGP